MRSPGLLGLVLSVEAPASGFSPLHHALAEPPLVEDADGKGK